MTPRFLKFIPFIFKWEGEVYENDPGDPGGATKFGIDQRSHPGVDIKAITKQRATEIYFSEWQQSQAETLPAGLGECYFNACVNCGKSRANKLFSDPAHPHTAAGFLDSQEDFYRRLVTAKPALKKFLKGWLNRTAELRRLVMA